MLRATVVALLLCASSAGMASGAPKAPLAPPPNDDLSGAVVFDALPFGYRQNTREATSETAEAVAPCDRDAHRGVWFRFTPTNSGRVRITTTGSSYRTVISVWLGDGHPLQPVTCATSGYDTATAAATLGVTQGVTYLVKVEADGAGGDLVLYAASLDAPPANDNLAAAEEIGELPYSHQVFAEQATREAGERSGSCGGDGEHGVWYRYAPEADGLLRLDTVDSDFDTVLSVWVGARHPLGQVACQTDNRSPTRPRLTVTVVAGRTYFIRAEPYASWPSSASPPGTLVLNAYVPPPPPANDDLANAMDIEALPFQHELDSAEATTEVGEARGNCGYSYRSNQYSLWYRFSPTSDGRLPIRVENATFDVVVSVWTGQDHPLREVACSNEVERGTMTVDVMAGETYLIKVESTGENGGQAQLLVTEARPIPTRPANDDLASAMDIAALPFAHEVDTTEATTEPDEAPASCGGYGNDRHSVWYRYQPLAEGRVPIQVAEAGFDVVASVWTGTIHPLRQVVCSGAVESRPFTFDVAAGATYYIKVEGYYESGGGPVRLEVQAPMPLPPRPDNDNLANAVEISSLPFRHDVDTTEATTEPDEARASCGGYGDNRHSVWYRYQAAGEGRLPIRVANAGFTVVASAWTGAGHPLQPESCSGNVDSGPLLIEVAAGETYLIKIEGYGEFGGQVRLVVDPLLPIPPPPPNDNLADAVDIAALPFEHEVDLSEATTEPDELSASCGGYGANRHSAWYRYQPADAGRVPIRATYATFNVVVSVWTGAAHPLQRVVCSNDVETTPLLLDVAGGETFYIKVEGYADFGGRLRLVVDEAMPIPPPPDNDDLANAMAITSLPFRHFVDTSEATVEPDEAMPGCGYGQDRHSVWYRFESESGVRLPIRVEGATFDAVVSVWSGDAHPLQAVACSDGVEFSPLEVDLAAGVAYYIKVEGYNDFGGRLRLVVDEGRPLPPRPDNDNLANATAVTALPFELELSTVDATTEPDEVLATCGGYGSNRRGVWFRYAPESDGQIRLHAQGSDYNTVVSVWQGAQHPLAQLACQDDLGSGGQSALNLPVRADSIYLIKVESYGEQGGRLVFHALVPPPPPDHDRLTAAVDISTLPFTHASDTTEATSEPYEAASLCGSGLGASLWYHHVPAADGGLRLTAEGAQLRVSVWVGTDHPLQEIACRGRLGTSSGDDLRLPVDAGTAYYVKVEPESEYYRGPYTVTVTAALPPPANDDVADAVPIDALPFTHRSTPMSAATWEPGEAQASCGGEAPGVWYRYTPAEDGRVRLDMAGSSGYGGALSVWTGAGHPLRELACGQDLGGGGPSGSLTLAARAGETYFLRASLNPSWRASDDSVVVNAYVPPPPPANDDLAAAKVMDNLPYRDTVDITEATVEMDEAPASCGGDRAAGSIWYRWAPSESGPVRLDVTESSYDTIISVWQGEQHPLTETACGYSRVDLDVEAGAVYLVRLSAAWQSNVGEVVLAAYLPPPAATNDDLAQATAIGALPFMDRVMTGEATTEPDEAVSDCNPAGGRSVWYRLTLPDTTRLRLDTRGSDYDTVLSVWTGTDHPLSPITCNDDEDDDRMQAALTFVAGTGTTYYIKAEGFEGAAGELTLRAAVADVDRPDVARVFLPVLRVRE